MIYFIRLCGLWLSCLIAFHTPDGGEIFIETIHIVAIRPIASSQAEHVARGTKALIYTTDKNFAVIENEEKIAELMGQCEKEQATPHP